MGKMIKEYLKDRREEESLEDIWEVSILDKGNYKMVIIFLGLRKSKI